MGGCISLCLDFPCLHVLRCFQNFEAAGREIGLNVIFSVGFYVPDAKKYALEVFLGPDEKCVFCFPAPIEKPPIGAPPRGGDSKWSQ